MMYKCDHLFNKICLAITIKQIPMNLLHEMRILILTQGMLTTHHIHYCMTEQWRKILCSGLTTVSAL